MSRKIKTTIVYDNLLFASPGHLMNHMRMYGDDIPFDIKYLTQCVFKKINVVKGIKLSYKEYDISKPGELEIYNRIKSLTRSGEGYTLGTMTPLDYFNGIIVPLMAEPLDPLQEAIDRAIEQGIGTERDYKLLVEEYMKSKENKPE